MKRSENAAMGWMGRHEEGRATKGRRGLTLDPRAAVATGILATATMDAAMVAAAVAGGKAFNCERLSPQIIGRWSAGLLRGRFRHADISTEKPVPGELVMGMAAHYGTGVALAGGFLVAADIAGRAPQPRHALAYGLATSVFPLFLMFPSMGYGPAGTRSGEAGTMVRTMLVGHLAFGAGIGFWTRRLSRRD